MSKLKTKPQCDMYALENKAMEEGKKLICGIDEAGRGPLAGPVVAAAVILDKENPIEGLNDSKKLSEKKRELLFHEIKEHALYYGIGWSTVEEIEEHNILQATFLAMKRAYKAMEVDADFVMVDGNRDPQLEVPTQTVISGDALSASIAAASILAKVSRDRYMVEMSGNYPEYNFAKHKGYGTKAHREALLEFGPSPIHRLSFLKKIFAKAKS